MAGYDWHSGMSNNAVLAYKRGICPASKIGRGIPASLVEKHCRYEEWHHASSRFNQVKFYDPEIVLATFGLRESEDYPVNPDAVADLAAHKASRRTKTETNMYEDCRVEWIHWGGTVKRPKPYPQSADGAKVEVRGNTATVTFVNGQIMVKRLTTAGFSFRAMTADEIKAYRKALKTAS